jgi:ABC-type nitrate/sulfonate/bicarbonate transport system substrate-binding protein
MPSNTTKNHPPEVFWYTRSPVPTPLGIAIQQGWLDQTFSPFGADIRSLQRESPQVRDENYVQTELNAFRQGGSIAAIGAKALGSDTRIIGLSWTDEFQAIITLPASGIKTVKDLKGRRLGLVRRHHAHIDIFRAAALRGYLNALKTVGLDERDVDLVDLSVHRPTEPAPRPRKDQRLVPTLVHPYTTELYALVSGDVDAIFVKGVQGAEITHLLNARVVINVGRHPDSKIRSNNGTPRTLTANNDWLINQPDVANQLLTQVHRAARWAAENPLLARQYIARETNSSEFWVEYAYGDDAHRHLDLTLDPHHIDALQDFADFLHHHQFVASRVDIAAWINPAPLERVKTDSRTNTYYR